MNNHKTITIFLLLAAMSQSAASTEHGQHHDHNHPETAPAATEPKPNKEQCDQIAIVQVNGLVCDFCARALEKVFGKEAAVAGIEVDLDAGYVVIEHLPNQSLPDAQLTEMITQSGYHVVAINRGCDDAH